MWIIKIEKNLFIYIYIRTIKFMLAMFLVWYEMKHWLQHVKASLIILHHEHAHPVITGHEFSSGTVLMAPVLWVLLQSSTFKKKDKIVRSVLCDEHLFFHWPLESHDQYRRNLSTFSDVLRISLLFCINFPYSFVGTKTFVSSAGSWNIWATRHFFVFILLCFSNGLLKFLRMDDVSVISLFF
jgi:hypothetical protein